MEFIYDKYREHPLLDYNIYSEISKYNPRDEIAQAIQDKDFDYLRSINPNILKTVRFDDHGELDYFLPQEYGVSALGFAILSTTGDSTDSDFIHDFLKIYRGPLDVNSLYALAQMEEGKWGGNRDSTSQHLYEHYSKSFKRVVNEAFLDRVDIMRPSLMAVAMANDDKFSLSPIFGALLNDKQSIERVIDMVDICVDLDDALRVVHLLTEKERFDDKTIEAFAIRVLCNYDMYIDNDADIEGLLDSLYEWNISESEMDLIIEKVKTGQYFLPKHIRGQTSNVVPERCRSPLSKSQRRKTKTRTKKMTPI
jgi:hypothetical protein